MGWEWDGLTPIQAGSGQQCPKHHWPYYCFSAVRKPLDAYLEGSGRKDVRRGYACEGEKSLSLTNWTNVLGCPSAGSIVTRISVQTQF